MNVIHVLEDFSFQSGGIRTVVLDLHTRLLNNNVNSKILSTQKEEGDEIIKVDGDTAPWRYSKNLKSTLKHLLAKNEIDLIHIHGVWMYPQYAAAKFAKQHNIPFLITCHGMYEPWLWFQGTLKKKLYFNLVVKSVFSKADFLHAITSNEAKEIKILFPKTPIVEIPNLIESNTVIEDYYNNKEKYVLYVGRLDPKKGIDLLIKAFANLNPIDFKLKIAGTFNDYKQELDELVDTLGLKNKVEFLGLITGEEKVKLFKDAFIFVAPSHSEVVGMVNLEAAIFKTPVITTFQTGLKKEWSNNGGLLVNPILNEIEYALKTVLAWTFEERNQNGLKLHDFVLKEYSWQYRFKDWLKLYKRMLK
ncbi:glycosyltransferase [Psychroserpens luteolus]|uniref:glycosyltransferase n=1 Tax=Psychroserpens luteolus TaxID=2855840 RepID=UPI001E53BF45|nr:glycosyltransferase [Psychroserpens luteolus]MCD2258231.1 glycosyltransferase [Psychroserpens luteolus]